MQIKIPLGESKYLVIEDWMDNKKLVKVSVVDANSDSSITLGLAERDDFKRAGRSM
jgi:hypothetical protein